MKDPRPLPAPPGARHPSWRVLLLFDLFLLALLILSTRLATFLHEAAGHAAAAALFGGQIRGVRLSLFGGGHAYSHFETALPLPGIFLVPFSGVLINLIFGFIALRYVRRLSRQPAWVLFFSLFGMVNVLGGLSYACLGLYYRIGDPAAWMRGTPWEEGWLWLPFLAASPLAAHVGVRSFLTPIRAWTRGTGFLERVTLLALTLGITTCAYAGLYGLTGQRSVAMETASLAHARAVEAVRSQKKAELLRRLREAFPDLSQEEAARLVDRTPIHIRPEEVPGAPPLMPVLALCQILGALTALRGMHRIPSSSDSWFTSRRAALACLLAAAVLAFLASTGGWIWKSGIHNMP
ncbi:MAG: hypothetical protein AB1512_29150 [Thermodesulfobacteriota bacterium]